MVCLAVVRKYPAMIQVLFYEDFSFLLNLILKQGRFCQTRHSLMVARILVSVVFFLIVRKGNLGFVNGQLAVCRENVLLILWCAVL